MLFVQQLRSRDAQGDRLLGVAIWHANQAKIKSFHRSLTGAIRRTFFFKN